MNTKFDIGDKVWVDDTDPFEGVIEEVHVAWDATDQHIWYRVRGPRINDWIHRTAKPDEEQLTAICGLCERPETPEHPDCADREQAFNDSVMQALGVLI